MLYLCSTRGEPHWFSPFLGLKCGETRSKVVKTRSDVVKITSDVVFRRSDVLIFSADLVFLMFDFAMRVLHLCVERKFFCFSDFNLIFFEPHRAKKVKS